MIYRSSRDKKSPIEDTISPNPALLGQAKAYEYIRVLAENKIDSKEFPLPSLRQLALDAKVPYISMQKTIAKLAANGCVKVLRSKGAFIISPIPTALPQKPRVSKSHSQSPGLSELIRDDIAKGIFKLPGFLPSIKELSRRYGVCFRSMKNALDGQVQDGVLQRKAKRYQIRSYANRNSRLEIFLITISDAHGSYSNLSPFRYDLLRALEYECQNLGMTLRVFTCRIELGTVHRDPRMFEEIDRSNRNRLMQGTLLLPFMITKPIISEICTRLYKSGKPVAVLDEVVDHEYRTTPLPSNFLFFSIAFSNLCGKLMGRFLVEKRYRKVAYVTSHVNQIWELNRFKGIELEFASKGGGTLVRHSFNLNNEKILRETDLNALKNGLDEKAREIGSLLKIPHYFLSNSRSEITQIADSLFKNAVHLEALRPIIDEIVADPEIDVIVCSNDTDAIAALDILNENKRLAPGIIGFDDSFIASSRGLTSYNFNIAVLANRMLTSILYPNMFTGKKTGEIEELEIEGFIAERDSTLHRGRKMNRNLFSA